MTDLTAIQSKLDAQTLIGPIWSDWVAGAVITPATMDTPDGIQHVAASQIELATTGTRSKMRTLTAPITGNTQKSIISERRF